MRDKEWLKEKIVDLFHTACQIGKMEYYEADQSVHVINELIDQLDEPEVLSQKWIESNTSPVDDEGRLYIWKRDLQNVIIPKQEEVDQAYKDGYEKGKKYTFYKGYLEGLADKENEPETVASVTKEEHIKSHVFEPDIVNRPTHYQGIDGLEARDVHENFVPKYAKYGGMVMCDMKDVVKYVLRAPDKNGVEDLKKAKRHLDWAISELEGTTN